MKKGVKILLIFLGVLALAGLGFLLFMHSKNQHELNTNKAAGKPNDPNGSEPFPSVNNGELVRGELTKNWTLIKKQ